MRQSAQACPTFVAFGGEGKTSLVAKWLSDLAYRGWPGCDVAFAWTFYNQGTREQSDGSSDLFLKEAISFFGDENDRKYAGSAADRLEKSKKLAGIISHGRKLLILDGVEPLQYSPTSPMAGQFKDHGIRDLLIRLAQNAQGLCVVTTQYSVMDLKAFWQTTAPEVPLRRLSTKAGVWLLKKLHVDGTNRELETLVEDVKGHALTLNLCGTFLRDAHGGDIRKRHLIKLQEADAEEQGGHAFRVMDAYVKSFASEGERGERALALLRLMGFFDRPVTVECLGALLKPPTIQNLTEPLVSTSEAQRNIVLSRLETTKLLTVNREASGALVSIDTHPLLREYFARNLQRKI